MIYMKVLKRRPVNFWFSIFTGPSGFGQRKFYPDVNIKNNSSENKQF